MSTSLYSFVSGEAEKLKSKGIEISVDDDLQINITRDDGGEVKYNNIYNKSEITAMNLANNLDKLEGFPDIEIFKEGELPSVKIDGKINNEITETYRKLYILLNSNFKNLSSWIENLVSLFNKSIKLTEENNKLIIKKLEYTDKPIYIADEPLPEPSPYPISPTPLPDILDNKNTTYLDYVSSFDELIRNYKENIDNIACVVENLYNQFDLKTSYVLSAVLVAVYAGLDWYLYKYDAVKKTINRTPMDKQEFKDEKDALLYMINNNLEAINVLVNAYDQLRRDHDNLEQRVNSIKSCDCNHDNDNDNSNEYVDEEFRDLRQKVSTNEIKSNINSAKSGMIDVQLFPQGAEEINLNITNANELIRDYTENLTDRNWDAPMEYIWDLLDNAWEVIEDRDDIEFTVNWRRNNLLIPRNTYIWDTHHHEWVRLTHHTRQVEEGWRENQNSNVPRRLNTMIKEGIIEWDNNLQRWVWNEDTDNLHDRDWNAAQLYVWSLGTSEWVILPYPENSNLQEGWRENHDIDDIPPNYIWDVAYQQWVLIQEDRENFTDNWRTNRNAEPTTINNFYSTLGHAEWYNTYNEWAWFPNIINDRTWRADDRWVWSINRRRWIEIIINNQFPSGWRTNRNWNAAVQAVWDIEHNEWVMIDSRPEVGWRRNRNNEFATSNPFNNIGRFVWSTERNEWEWASNELLHNRGWLTPNDFAWSLEDNSWTQISNYDENIFVNDWRTNRYLNIPDNFIWNDVIGEWQLISNDTSIFPKNWRFGMINEEISNLFESFVFDGELKKDETRNEWIIDIQQIDLDVSPLSLENNSTEIAIPGYDKDVFKYYGLSITDNDEEINPDKPVLGNMTIKGNLIVNGTIESSNGIVSGGSSGDSNFKLVESDQLYLYKPSEITEDNNYYIMKWNIDEDYDIPLNLQFKFKEYLFGHSWELKWDGDVWTGNNCVNMCYAKMERIKTNDGSPGLAIKHTDIIAKWIKEVVYPDMPEDHSKVNFAKILYPYLKNWRVIKKDGSVVNEGFEPDPSENGSTFEHDGYTINQLHIDLKAPSDLGSTESLYVKCDLNIPPIVL